MLIYMATTIQLTVETREKLKCFGYKGESYNAIIERLMEYCEDLNVAGLVEERWKRLQKEKHQYISLDEI